jgi:adenylate cyclase
MAEVASKVGVSFESGGERSLKNIAKPVHLYYWSMDGSKTSSSGLKTAEAGNKPTLALLPLEPIGHDKQSSTRSTSWR